LNVPVTVGVPLIVPVVAPIFKPAGKEPTEMDHAGVPITPVARIVSEYALPYVPSGSGEFVVIEGLAASATPTNNVGTRKSDMLITTKDLEKRLIILADIYYGVKG
jgi:hypothetical protein